MLYAHYAQILTLEERRDTIHNLKAGHPGTDARSFLGGLDEGIARLGAFRPAEDVSSGVDNGEGQFPWQT